MAGLWPRELPRSVRSDPRRRAEVRVYDKLAAVLDDSYTVFYSSPWLGVDKYGNERDGECDFLVAHPDRGYLAIEVKGGGISFDPAARQWWTTDRNGFKFKIDDPVEQARSAKHELLKKLKADRHWQERWIHNAHGVIFPDAASPPHDLGADRPARIFCCQREFADGLAAWIDARLKEARGTDTSRGLGKDGVDAFEKILARPFSLSFQISGAIEEARDDLAVLEPTQFHILEHIADIPRAEIRGGAGTGKTVVAIEDARRAVVAGRRTLLTCYGRPLANELARKAGSPPLLTVGSFHAIALQIADTAGLVLPPPNQRDQTFFDAVLPDLLMDATSIRPDLKWQHIVVDEAQDFKEDWWVALDATLAEGGVIRILSDANQRVYGNRPVPTTDLQLVPIRLTRNLRNTKLIHAAASRHYQGPEIVAEGPPGIPVRWIETAAPDELVAAAYVELRRLVYQEEVPPSDIAVLLPNGQWVEQFKIAASRSSFEFSDCTDLRTDHIVVDTTRRFKGLERPATIIVVGDGDMTQTELAYVGFSRARFYLAVVSQAADAHWLRPTESVGSG